MESRIARHDEGRADFFNSIDRLPSFDVQGRISKAGDTDVRRSLYEAASGLMTRFKGKDKVKSWRPRRSEDGRTALECL